MSEAVIVAVGVNTDGQREVLGLKVGASEAEPFWTEFLRSLNCRGLRGVKLVIGDCPVAPEPFERLNAANDRRIDKSILTRSELGKQPLDLLAGVG